MRIVVFCLTILAGSALALGLSANGATGVTSLTPGHRGLAPEASVLERVGAEAEAAARITIREMRILSDRWRAQAG